MKRGAKVITSDICYWSANQMANAVRNGEISATKLVETILKRIDHVNPTINAYATVTHQQALDEAEIADAKLQQGARVGPLHGVPVSIKDVIHTKGIPTTCGSRLFAGYVPTEDAIVVERLRRAGAIIIGKTNTPEFAHLPITENLVHGVTRNPWDPSRTAGGSSGGSAAAVAAGLGPISIGNDGGGSVRIPAALCGVVGLKPTFGAIPQHPKFPGWDLLGHTGPFARNVRDIKLVMDAIAGPDVRDPDSLTNGAQVVRQPAELTSLKVAWTTSLSDMVSTPEIAARIAYTARCASQIGCDVEEVALDWGDPNQHFRVLVAAEMAAAVDSRNAEDKGKLSPTLLRLADFGSTISAVQYVRALEWRSRLKRQIFDWFTRFDILIAPVTPIAAFPLGQVGPKEVAGRKGSPFAWLGWTPPFNLTGQPALSLPCGLTAENLPIGVQIVAQYGADDLLLEVSEAIESKIGFNEAFQPDETALAPPGT